MDKLDAACVFNLVIVIGINAAMEASSVQLPMILDLFRSGQALSVIVDAKDTSGKRPEVTS